MKALLLTDEEHDALIAGKSSGSVAVHKAARRAVTLGGLDGVLVTFGDGCDGDTWSGCFGHLAGGYTLKVTNTIAGNEVEGQCLSVDPFVLESQTEHDSVSDRTYFDASQIAAIHIY